LKLRLDGVEKSLTAKFDAKIDGLEKNLNVKIDGLEKTLTSMRNAFWAVAGTFAAGILILFSSQISSHK
jgi:hypothetical protein